MPHIFLPREIRTALDHVLPTVEKPTRYLGLERNLVKKNWDEISIRMALVFPDTYEIGMSHQGSRILYHLVNRRSDALLERAYTPWPDMAGAMRKAELPLYSLESYHPISDFDIVGITLQSELNYVNVPEILDLGGIPLAAEDRSEEDPIILGGGPCTANPEPMSYFFDAFLIGDAEAGLDEILDLIREAKKDHLERKLILKTLASLPGVYVPSLYETRGATLFPRKGSDAPKKVRRIWTEELKAEDQPELPIVPFAEVVQDRIGMEIMRGCTQGCRFCQAGFWYRPVREHDPDTISKRIEAQVDETGFEQISLLSLSSADYSKIQPLVSRLSRNLADRRVSVALPSLRADAFSVDLADAVSRVRKSGFTFAPETGSDRLRRVINKTFTNSEMIEAADAVFSRGWKLIKVYAMIGLPTERDEDLLDLVKLANELVQVGRRRVGHSAQVKVSVGCFIPKAWTPFQWQAFVDPAELQRRIFFLKDHLRRVKGVKLNWNAPEEAAHEALLSRGGRELGPAIRRAWELGASFDGWGELSRPEAWRSALEELEIDPASVLGEKSFDESLPWDVIDAGVSTEYLKAEWRRACKEQQTPDCKWGKCVRCGIPGNGSDIRLAPAMATLADNCDEPATPFRASELSPPKQPVQSPLYRKIRFRFEKCGDSRFLSHRQTMDTLERVLRASGVPVRFTEGFNPHIRLSMGPALSLGHEALAEFFDVDCSAPVRPAHLETANTKLPEGLRLLESTELLNGAPSLGKLLARSRYHFEAGKNWPLSMESIPPEAREGLISWECLSDGSVRMEMNIRSADGPTGSLRRLFAGLGISPEEARILRIQREALILQPPRLKKREGRQQ